MPLISHGRDFLPADLFLALSRECCANDRDLDRTLPHDTFTRSCIRRESSSRMKKMGDRMEPPLG